MVVVGCPSANTWLARDEILIPPAPAGAVISQQVLLPLSIVFVATISPFPEHALESCTSTQTTLSCVVTSNPHCTPDSVERNVTKLSSEPVRSSVMTVDVAPAGNSIVVLATVSNRVASNALENVVVPLSITTFSNAESPVRVPETTWISPLKVVVAFVG